MKIVVNSCFGGFGLSEKAMVKIAQRKGITVYPYTEHMITYYPQVVCTSMDEIKKASDQNLLFSYYDLGRTDPDMIAVVEELGEEANGYLSKLRIADIPDDVEWEIDDYDGVESIHEVHRSW